MTRFREKTANVLGYVYGTGIAIALFVGALSFIGYLVAIIIGGATAEAICEFIYKKIYPAIFYISSVSVVLGLVKIYISGETKLQRFIKRAFDLTVSIVALIVLTVIPVMIVIPIVIKLTSKGPAVFTQERVGKDGKIFKIYKFRTMLIPEESFDKDGNQLEPKQRITKVGRFLRKTSLDELMQLFNIINGTMSIVGPRPTLPYQVERYTDRQKKRLDMRPGVTGWAQVNGRNDLTWGEKIEFDIEYIEKFSLWFDIKILFKTVAVVLGQKGIAFTKNDAINAKPPVEKTEEAEKIKK